MYQCWVRAGLCWRPPCPRPAVETDAILSPYNFPLYTRVHLSVWSFLPQSVFSTNPLPLALCLSVVSYFLPHLPTRSLSSCQCRAFPGFTFHLGESVLCLAPLSPHFPRGSQTPVLSGEAPPTSLQSCLTISVLFLPAHSGGVRQAFLLVPFPVFLSGFGLCSSVSCLG